MARESSSNRLWLLSCLIAYTALGGILAIALYQRAGAPVLVEEPPRIGGSTGPSPLEQRLNPNTAEWYDLARLPRVGESLARRIIAYREAKVLEWRSSHPDQPAAQTPPVFVKPEDLLPVKGIGPKTLALIRPYLRLDAPASRPGS